MEQNVESRWHYRFIDIARLVAHWSKDLSTKCGAVIVRPDNTICSTGYNGFPKGVRDDKEAYANREEKYARIIHAELNAILYARESVTGYTIYTYQDPMIGPSCDRCSAHIIQAGICKVVCLASTPPERWLESINRGLQMYDEAMIEVIRLG